MSLHLLTGGAPVHLDVSVEAAGAPSGSRGWRTLERWIERGSPITAASSCGDVTAGVEDHHAYAVIKLRGGAVAVSLMLTGLSESLPVTLSLCFATPGARLWRRLSS